MDTKMYQKKTYNLIEPIGIAYEASVLWEGEKEYYNHQN